MLYNIFLFSYISSFLHFLHFFSLFQRENDKNIFHNSMTPGMKILKNEIWYVCSMKKLKGFPMSEKSGDSTHEIISIEKKEWEFAFHEIFSLLLGWPYPIKVPLFSSFCELFYAYFSPCIFISFLFFIL